MGFFVLPRLQRLPELLPVQSDFLRQLGEDFRITDILLFLEKRSQNTAIVFIPTPFLLRVLKSLKGQMGIRLGDTRGSTIRIPILSAIGYTELAQAVCR